MKVEPTPTSPKTKAAQQARELESLYKSDEMRRLDPPHKKQSFSTATIVLSVVLAFCAGVLGSFVATVYLGSDSALSRWLSQGFNAGTTTVPSHVSTATSQQEVVTKVNTETLAIFELKKGTAVPDALYGVSEQKGSAILLTNDGWAVTTAAVVQPGKEYAAVTYDRKVLAVSSLFRDPATNLVYFHVDGSRFSVADLGSIEDTAQFEPFSVMAGSGQQSSAVVVPVTVQGLHDRSAGSIVASDIETNGVTLSENVSSVFLGGPLFDKKGSVVGILAKMENGKTSAVTAGSIREVLPGLLRDKSIQRPSLGVQYVDLARTPGIPEQQRQLKNEGALLVATKDVPAVSLKSPAALAGLQEGDVITKVGDLALTESVGLSDAVHRFSPGQSVVITYLRAQTEHTVHVTLGTMSL